MASRINKKVTIELDATFALEFICFMNAFMDEYENGSPLLWSMCHEMGEACNEALLSQLSIEELYELTEVE